MTHFARRLSLRSHPLLARSIACVLLAALTGCQEFDMSPSPPVGPGAATKSDLRPWLASAESVTFTGQLMYFDVISRPGVYPTWSMYPAGPYMGVEIDVRKCREAAENLQEKQVIVQGKLISRGRTHTPLLVAERIMPTRPAFPVASLDAGR